MDFYETIVIALQNGAWLGLLVARVLTGIFFAVTGYGKVFNPKKAEQMEETMEKADIPMPDETATFVSWVELIGGILLIIGLLTPLASLALLITMVVAVVTVDIKNVEAEEPMKWLGEVLFMPQVLYIIILLWIFLAGPGPLSIDSLLLGSA